MKKILTMLLSFLMVATLGVVNVSAENKSSSYVFNITKSDNLDYDGGLQTLFEFSGLNTNSGKELEDDYKVYYAVREGSDFNYCTINWIEYTGHTVTIKNVDNETTTPVGHYFFVAAVLKSDELEKQLHQIDNKNKSSVADIYVTQKNVKVTIKAPMTAKEDGKNVEYFDVGSEKVELPFSATTDVTGVELKWTLNEGLDSNISYDSTSGKLTIDSGLSAGVHEVTLIASVNDETNYTGKASVSFKVIKATTAGYVIAFDGSEYDQTSQKNELVFGKKVNEISNGVSSISYRDSTYNVWTKDSTTTSITSKTLSDRDGNVLSKGKLNVGKDYQIKATVKTTYYYDGVEQSYSFDVSDKFDVVAKEASAAVKAKEDLVYNGAQQKLLDVSGKEPSNTTIYCKVSNTKVEGTAEEAYNSLSTVKPVKAVNLKGTDAGTYYVYYLVDPNDTQNYKDSYGMVEVTIAPKSIEEFTVTALDSDNKELKELTYNGSEQKPATIVVKDGDTTLSENDYKVEYYRDGVKTDDLTSVGTITVVVTGANNYEKTASTSYKIAKKSIKDDTIVVTPADDVTYNGKSQQQKPVIKDTETGETLVEGNDYTLEYPDDTTNAGEITVTVQGAGNYKHNFEITYKIARKSIEDLTIAVTAPEDVTYNGKSQQQKPVIKDADTTLKEGTDYTLTYSEDTTNTGNVTVTIKGIGNYKDETSTIYKIARKSIKDNTITVTPPEDVTYNGKSQQQKPVIKDTETGKTLVEGSDYTLTYPDDTTNAGEVTVTVQGAGNYKHSFDFTYTISPATANMVWATTKTTYYKNTETTAVLTCDGVYGDFLDLQIKTGENEWKEVSKSNYDAHSGSTVIVLKKDYLQTLEVGKDYTFRLVYGANYINYPTTVLAVREYTAPSNSSSSSSSTTTTTTAKKVVNTSAH